MINYLLGKIDGIFIEYLMWRGYYDRVDRGVGWDALDGVDLKNESDHAIYVSIFEEVE